VGLAPILLRPNPDTSSIRMEKLTELLREILPPRWGRDCLHEVVAIEILAGIDNGKPFRF